MCHVLDEVLRPLQGILHAFKGKPTTFGLSLLACLLLLGAVNTHLHKLILAQWGNMWFESNEISISETVHFADAQKMLIRTYCKTIKSLFQLAVSRTSSILRRVVRSP